MVLADFTVGYEIMNKPYRELNDKTVIERQNEDQKKFNSFQDPKSNDPDEAWKSNAIRPITRNRTISIAAHVTGSLMFPHIFAQNENQEEDKDCATVMRDLMEWSADQAGYEKTILYAVIAALVNPAVIVHTEYAEVYRKIKEITSKDKWEEKEVLDEILSGFQDSIVPIDELFIGDIYEHDIQKQPFLIRRRAIDYRVAEAKYGEHENFKKYVRAGLQILSYDGGATFYEQFDENLRERLVEEIIYYNRSKDLQLVFCNGVLVCKPDYPNPRKDKKYPYTKTGYELIDEGKFFYYKSLVSKMSSDQDVVDTLYRMVIDGSFLRLMPPIAAFGGEEIKSNVIVPGKVTRFSDTAAKMDKIDIGNDLQAGYSALERVEQSISESSNDVMQSGQGMKGAQTAFEVSRLEQNARIMLGLFGKMIGFLVKEYGELRISDILQFMTVAEVDEISNGVKFRSFVMPEKTVDGSTKSRKIDFTLDVSEEPKTKDQILEESFGLLDEEGGLDSRTQIFKVNPNLFRRMKYLVKVTPDVVTPPSENVKKALNLEEFDRLITLPFIDQEAVTRDLLLGSYDATKDDPDKYILDRSQMQMAQAMGMEEKPGGMAQKLANPTPGGTSELLSKVV